MKKIFLLVTLTLLLCSCSQKRVYRDDLDCSALTAPLAQSGDYSSYGDEKIKFFFEDTDLATDYSIVYSTEPTDIDELGVFLTDSPESARELHEITLDYLGEYLESDSAFISSYAPEELPKLSEARTAVYGNYVVYAILDPSTADATLAQIENSLLIR